MQNSQKNNNNIPFLKKGLQDDISKHHKKYLGTDVPKDYFVISKASILDKIKEENKSKEKPKKQLFFYLRPQFKYMVAASLIFMVSLSIWLQQTNHTNKVNDIDLEELAFSDAILINSLLIEDTDVDAFADATLFNEIVVKAELTEQKMDNLILNLLIVEDSLLDDYIGDEFVNTLIL